MPGSVLSFFGLEENRCRIIPFGNGLINHTWKVSMEGSDWLLQKINQQVFRNPEAIMKNLLILSDYFINHFPEYLFVAPVVAASGENYFRDQDGEFYRLFPFVKNSWSCDTVPEPAMAYEASRQFGKFTRLLSRFETEKLLITLPDFHNLPLRYRQFENSVQSGNQTRIEDCREFIEVLKSHRDILEKYERIKQSKSFHLRVVHHDAKINNVLFDRNKNTGLCIVDLDTVMPGYYISDVGDMLRTYICPVDEEEKDFSKISIREEYFREIARGYLGEMQSELSNEEKEAFVYAGKFAIYMQALRFLTDHLNDDVYYSIKYTGQNLIRAGNQITVLQRYLEKEDKLNEILNAFTGEVA